MATLTPEFTTPWTNIILCWKPVSFPRLTKFQPCNSVLHVCSTFSRGKESSLHPLRAIYSSRCSLAKARPTESAPLTENRTPRLSGSWQNFFFSCFVYKFKNGAVLRQQDQPSLFPLFPVFYNPNDGNTGENLYMLSKEKVYFLFSWFSISVLRQYTQPGQVSVVQRPSEKLSGTGCYLPFENTPLEKFFQIRILWGMQQRSILPPPLTPPGN